MRTSESQTESFERESFFNELLLRAALTMATLPLTFSLASRKVFVMKRFHPSTISSSCDVVMPSKLIFVVSTLILTLSASSRMCSWLSALYSVGKLNKQRAWSIVLKWKVRMRTFESDCNKTSLNSNWREFIIVYRLTPGPEHPKLDFPEINRNNKWFHLEMSVNGGTCCRSLGSRKTEKICQMCRNAGFERPMGD